LSILDSEWMNKYIDLIVIIETIYSKKKKDSIFNTSISFWWKINTKYIGTLKGHFLITFSINYDKKINGEFINLYSKLVFN